MIRKLALPLLVGALVAPAHAQVRLEDAWVRALPPIKKVTAAYLSVVNDSDQALAIVGGSAPDAGRVEIHRTVEVDGMMRMEQVEGLAVAPGERLELAPGGVHLMLLDLKYMPQPGDDFELCLTLASGEEICTVADTRKSADAAGRHHHH